MDETALFRVVEAAAIKINQFAIKLPIGLGFAIEIPKQATPEAREGVDKRLTELCWNFERSKIGDDEYYVLFPL